MRPSGSWVYVWLDVADGSVVYIGTTGFDPELRAHLHLTSENPDHGRIRAFVPRYDERDFDVLAFALPADVTRPAAKAALTQELASRGLVEEPRTEGPALHYVTGPMVDAIEKHVAEH